MSVQAFTKMKLYTQRWSQYCDEKIFRWLWKKIIQCKILKWSDTGFYNTHSKERMIYTDTQTNRQIKEPQSPIEDFVDKSKSFRSNQSYKMYTLFWSMAVW